jgi:hypothetical protein
MVWADEALGLIAYDWEQWRSFPYMLEESCKWGEPLTKEVANRYFW